MQTCIIPTRIIYPDTLPWVSWAHWLEPGLGGGCCKTDTPVGGEYEAARTKASLCLHSVCAWVCNSRLNVCTHVCVSVHVCKGACMIVCAA